METVDKQEITLIIAAEDPPLPNTTGNLKNDASFLVNDEIQSKNDEQNFKKRWIRNMKKLPMNVITGAV